MAAIVPFLDRTKRTQDTGTPDAQCPVGEPPGGPLPTLEGLLGDVAQHLGDVGDDLVEGLGPPKFDGLGAVDEKTYESAVPGLLYRIKKIAANTYFQIIHAASGHPLFRHSINVKGGGGVTRMMRVADAVFGSVRMDWTVDADKIDTHLGPRAVAEFESWLVDGTYGTQYVKPGAPEAAVRSRHFRAELESSNLGDFGVVRDVPELESSHAELTRTVWIRRAIEEALLTGGKGGGPRDFWVESDCKTGELFFHLHPAMEKDILPWYVGVHDTVRFSLFGSNGKMKCPTWDLPAGSPAIGGSCPGATAGQTVVEPEKRRGQLVDGQLPPVPGLNVIQPVDERRSICQNCYALEGNYPSPHVQVGEILRYWWTRSMIAEGMAEEWIETMVKAIGALNIPLTRQGVRPIRVHSAGDFFSPAYAEAWMEVANRVWDLEVTYGRTTPEIRFWAPTRAWAARGFDWEKIADRLQQPNMIVRPSSYHVDDPAPGTLAQGWPMGATSIINDHNYGMTPEHERALASSDAGRMRIAETYKPNRGAGGQGHDERYDWDCQTYAIKMNGGGDLAPSCEDATAPDGKRGCRACWMHPELRINYTTH